MKIILSKRDAVWSYLGVFISMGASFIVLPFVLYFLDDDSIGLYYIFLSLGAFTYLFDFGFSPAFARNVAYCWSGSKSLKSIGGEVVTSSEPDYHLFRDVLSACKYIYRIISSLAFLFIMGFGFFYISYISSEIDSNSPLYAWAIYSVSLLINLYFGYYSVFLRGVGAIAEVNKITVIAKLIQISGTIIFLILGFGLIGTSIGSLLYGISFRLIAKRSFENYEGIGLSLKRVQKQVDKQSVFQIINTIWYNAWRDGLVSLSTYLLGQAGTVVSSLFLSLMETGIYSLSMQLAVAIATIAATFSSMNQPVLQSAYITGDQEKQKTVLSFNIISYIVLYFLGFGMLVSIGLPIIKMIKPAYQLSISIILGIGSYQFLLHLRNCYGIYLSTTNRVIYYKSFIISAVICIFLEILFTGFLHIGVWGLIAAQILSQVFYNIWKWPIYVHNELGLSATSMLKYSTKELGLFFQKRETN